MSKETVATYRTLLLDVLEWYERTLIEKDKQNERYISDPNWSLPAVIRKEVESGQDVPGGELKSLGTILDEYQNHIAGLSGKPWIRQGTATTRLEQISRLRREL